MENELLYNDINLNICTYEQEEEFINLFSFGLFIIIPTFILSFSSIYIKHFLSFSFFPEETLEVNKDKNTDTNKIIEQPISNDTNNKIVIFENKYLDKFKSFPNHFIFNDNEKSIEENMYINIKQAYENTFYQQKTELENKLLYIKPLLNISNDELLHYNNSTILKIFEDENINSEQDSDEENENNYSINKHKIENIFDKVNNKLKQLLDNQKKDEDFKTEAYNYILNSKLDKFINNYVVEYTPLGNVYMRYNNDKKTFEYFSNNSIPYRYLEPIGRKYVMTYWCKPIFIDLEEELKLSEMKYEEKKKLEEENKKLEEKKNIKKDVLVKLKNYNNNKEPIKPLMSKNRPQNNFVLPQQIKANLPNVNTQNEKQLLKENANRYTWEGRLTSFSPLKKIDKKVFDKKLELSYAEFKKLNKTK